MAGLFCLSHSDFPILPLLSCVSCSACHFCLSYSAYPVLAVLSCQRIDIDAQAQNYECKIKERESMSVKSRKVQARKVKDREKSMRANAEAQILGP
jgi:hypothetical protein